MGLASSSLPSEILERPHTEDDLLAVLSTPTEATTKSQVPVTESTLDEPTLQPATPDTDSVIAEIHHKPRPAAAASAAASAAAAAVPASPCLVARPGLRKTTAKCQALVHHHLPPLNLVKVTLLSNVAEQEKHRYHRPSAWLNEAESTLKQAKLVIMSQFPSPWWIEEGGST